MDLEFPSCGKVSEYALEFLAVQAFDLLGLRVLDLERDVLSEQTDEGMLARNLALLTEFFESGQAKGSHFLFHLAKGLRIHGAKHGAFDDAFDPGLGKPVGAEQPGIGR